MEQGNMEKINDEIRKAKKQLLGYRYLHQMMETLDLEIGELNCSDDSSPHNLLIADRHLKIKELAEQCLKIDQEIDKLPALERAVIRYRYILCIPWEDICEKIGYEWAQTYRIHRRALTMFYQIHTQDESSIPNFKHDTK